MMQSNPSSPWIKYNRSRIKGKLIQIYRNIIPAPLPYYTKIIQLIVNEMRPIVYVEIGIFTCETFNSISPMVDTAIGVDIWPNAQKYMKKPHGLFLEGNRVTLEQYLIENSLKPDLIFIYADHEKNDVIQDFETVAPFLQENGVIILHDTWPANEVQSTPEFCHNAWEAVGELREKYKSFSFVTLPIHPGLTFIQRNSSKPLWTSEIIKQ